MTDALSHRRTGLSIDQQLALHTAAVRLGENGKPVVVPGKEGVGLQPEESIELRLMAKTPGLDRAGRLDRHHDVLEARLGDGHALGAGGRKGHRLQPF